MSGAVEAAGDVVTGGLMATAVERPGGGRGDDPSHGICLNCGTTLTGPYCHACGQPGHIHRSLAAIWHDLAHGVLHFEGKIWRTLPMLAFRPGELTRRYVHGERARFVSPLALFLFSVFLMFAVINTVGGHLETPEINVADTPAMRAQVTNQIEIQRKGIANAERSIAEAKAAGRDTAGLRADLATRRAMLKTIEKGSHGEVPSFANIKTGWPEFDKGIAKANANPNLALYKIQSNAYKFSWALIPISVPFVWLMFLWHFRRRVYDHAIFVTYSLAFMSLLTILLTVLWVAGVNGAVIGAATMIIPPIHIYRQLKGAYEIGRFGALIRTFLLIVFSTIALTLFLLLLLGLGLNG
jgi:hypothetical protein